MNIFRYLISHGIVRILGENGVSKSDMKRVLEAARGVVIPNGYKIVHVFPLEYIVDNKKEIENPLKMKGFRLEVKAILIIKR